MKKKYESIIIYYTLYINIMSFDSEKQQRVENG